MMCSSCHRAIERAFKESKPLSGTRGCGPLQVWTEHTRTACEFCIRMAQDAVGGRKKKKTGGLKCSESTSDKSCTVSSPDNEPDPLLGDSETCDRTPPICPHELIAIVNAKAMPAYKATVELAPERFSEVYDDLKCSVCYMLPTELLNHLAAIICFVLGVCVYGYKLPTHALFASQFCMQNSYYRRIASSVVYSVKPPCGVISMKSTWVGCQKKMKLRELRERTAICAHNPSVTATPLPNVVTGSTTFKEAIAASPSKFKSKACNTTFVHILKSKAENDKLEVQTQCARMFTN